MKIKTLNDFVSSHVKQDSEGKLIVSCCCEDDVDIPVREISTVNNEKLCLSKVAKPNEEFFFKMTGYKYNSAVSWMFGAATIKKHGDQTEFIITKEMQKSWRGGKMVISPYVPSLSDLIVYFDNCLLTSEGLISLNEGDFLGCVNNDIENLTVKQLLTRFSKEKTETSPSYKQLKLQSSRKRPERPVKGTMIYNEASDELEIYGKNGWRRIETEEI